MRDGRIFRRWVRTTWAGWVLGIPLIIIMALAGEAVGVGGVQVIVGAGMGAGIGLTQRRVIKSLLHKSSPWFWSCVVGLAAPFLAADISRAAVWDSGYSLPASVAIGGILVGSWQAFILSQRFQRTGWWVVGSTAGWIMASGMTAIADYLFRSRSLQGIWGALLYLGIIAGGGLILGVVTAVTLVWILRQKKNPIAA